MPPEELSATSIEFARWTLVALLQFATVFAFSFLPGWWIACRLRMEAPVRLLAAVTISFGILFLIETLVYCLKLPAVVAPVICGLASAVSVVSLVRARRWPEMGGNASIWLVVGWVALALILLSAEARIFVHALPQSYFDWYEHWARTTFFIEQQDIETKFGSYHLAARAPLMNAVAAVCMSACGTTSYGAFQIVATVLNAFPVVPMALLMSGLTGISLRRSALFSALILGTMPFLVFNGTYTWTKSFTAGLIVAAFYLYWLGLSTNRVSRCAWSFPCLALAFMSHFLALMYAALLGGHFVFAFFRRKWPWRSLVMPGLVSVLIVAGWFGYLIAKAGLATTLGSNTTMGGGSFAEEHARDASGEIIPPLEIFKNNLRWNFTTPGKYTRQYEILIPTDGNEDLRQIGTWKRSPIASLFGNFADNGLYWTFLWSGVFLLILALGLIVWRLFLGLWGHFMGGRAFSGPGLAGFWTLVIVGGYVLNIAPVRWPGGNTFNQNLHALVILVVVIAFRELMRLPTWIRIFLFSCFLIHQAANSWALIRHMELDFVGGKVPSRPIFKDYWGNYVLKMNSGAEYLADTLGPYRDVGSAALFMLGLILLWLLSSGPAPMGSLPAAEGPPTETDA